MSLWNNQGSERWDKNVPASLIPAIKHLRQTFEMVHCNFGLLTESLCYKAIHNGTENENHKAAGLSAEKCAKALKRKIGAVATQRFDELVAENTPPSSFKAFYDLYLEGLKITALLIFKDLLEVGRANEEGLGIPFVRWAESQTKHLIRSHRHDIKLWVVDVCDGFLPSCDLPLTGPDSYFQRWQAPSLLVMKPSRLQPYDATRAWERNDTETSLRWLKMFADDYVLRLEIALEDAAGRAALELAKQPTVNTVAGDAAAKNERAEPKTEDSAARVVLSSTAQAKAKALNAGTTAKDHASGDATDRDRKAWERAMADPKLYPALSVAQVAYGLHRHPSTIYRLINEGKLTKTSIGKITVKSVKAVQEQEQEQ
jgi:hypothetical protein